MASNHSLLIIKVFFFVDIGQKMGKTVEYGKIVGFKYRFMFMQKVSFLNKFCYSGQGGIIKRFFVNKLTKRSNFAPCEFTKARII